MDIILVRHGEANLAGVDRERSLTKSGRGGAERVGRFLSMDGIICDFIFSSEKARAKETSLIIAEELGLNPSIIRESRDLSPNSNPEEMGDVISAYRGENSVIVVSHMPAISLYASFLLRIDSLDRPRFLFGTCGIASLTGEKADRSGSFNLNYFKGPREIPGN